MNSPTEINVALIRALGIDELDVRAVNIKLRPTQYPLVTVQRFARRGADRLLEAGELATITQRYQLTPKP